MKERHVEESYIDPMNVLIVFLLGLASFLFILGTVRSFEVSGTLQVVLIAIVSVLYVIALFAFLRPKKIKTPVGGEREIVEREVERIVEKPVEKIIYRDRPGKEKIVEKEVHKPVIIGKKEKSKTKYVGSTYNEKYHVRSCRFAGMIKPKYLVEENDRKYFDLRGYEPCKNCKPDKN